MDIILQCKTFIFGGKVQSCINISDMNALKPLWHVCINSTSPTLKLFLSGLILQHITNILCIFRKFTSVYDVQYKKST